MAKSQEISSVAVFFAALAMFAFTGSWMMNQLSEYTKFFLSQAGILSFGVENAPHLLIDITTFSLTILAPFLFAVALAALIANLAQVGFMFSTKVFKFSPSKFNPVTGMKKFFPSAAWQSCPKPSQSC